MSFLHFCAASNSRPLICCLHKRLAFARDERKTEEPLIATWTLSCSTRNNCKPCTALNREIQVDQPDLRLNPKVTLRLTTPMSQAEPAQIPTRSQHRLYDNGPLDQTIRKQIIMLKLRRGEHRDARASREREGECEGRGEEKKEKREWRAGEKTTLTALLLACSVLTERSGQG